LIPKKGRYGHDIVANVGVYFCIAQIRASSIDFWTKNYDFDGMKLRHRNLLYPPRIKMTLVLKASVLILPISFQGCTDDSDVDAELPITGIV
jgi:hypothetical protein